MSINTIIGVVVAVIVIGAGAWYLSTTPNASAPAQEQSGSETTSGTFGQLMALGGSSTCTVNVDTPESPAEGTVYISGGEVRVDFVAEPASFGGREISAHMIQTGGYIYSWSDLLPQGVKVKAEAAGNAGESQGIDPNAAVRYSCSPWIPDASKFTPPATVIFTEFSAGAMPTAPQPM